MFNINHVCLDETRTQICGGHTLCVFQWPPAATFQFSSNAAQRTLIRKLVHISVYYDQHYYYCIAAAAAGDSNESVCLYGAVGASVLLLMLR